MDYRDSFYGVCCMNLQHFYIFYTVQSMKGDFSSLGLELFEQAIYLVSIYMIESLNTLHDYREIISQNLSNCIEITHGKGLPKYQGKVRDRYDIGDAFMLITTDRQSAFDRVLATIPFKGQVLNQTGAWWFEQTKDIITNHLLEVPHPNISIATKCKPFPIEFVVRGFMTGTSSTSILDSIPWRDPRVLWCLSS